MVTLLRLSNVTYKFYLYLTIIGACGELATLARYTALYRACNQLLDRYLIWRDEDTCCGLSVGVGDEDLIFDFLPFMILLLNETLATLTK